MFLKLFSPHFISYNDKTDPISIKIRDYAISTKGYRLYTSENISGKGCYATRYFGGSLRFATRLIKSYKGCTLRRINPVDETLLTLTMHQNRCNNMPVEPW